MTSSETRTESRKQARTKHKSRAAGGRNDSAPSGSSKTEAAGEDGSANQTEGRPGAPAPGLPAPIIWGGLALLLLGGWLGILQINRWEFGPPVFFLCTGWLAVLLTGWYLWTAGMAAAEADDRAAEAEFWRPEGPRDELQREKRALLKAIKEIEFDHQMGKMSDRDATELSTFYRSRAIEIIKALERARDDGRELSVTEKIERELKARMSVQQVKVRAQNKAQTDSANRADAGDEPKEKVAVVPSPAETASDAPHEDAAEAVSADEAGEADDQADDQAEESAEAASATDDDDDQEPPEQLEQAKAEVGS